MIFLIDIHPSKKNVRAVVKPPKNYEVVCVNDKSESVITRDIHIKKQLLSVKLPMLVEKKEKGEMY